MVRRVRLSFYARYSRSKQPYVGGIRKQLGLELNGETRGVTERFVTGDLEVKNLSNDVITFLRLAHVIRLTTSQYWHIWGDPATIL